jgi:hypothetical protein
MTILKLPNLNYDLNSNFKNLIFDPTNIEKELAKSEPKNSLLADLNIDKKSINLLNSTIINMFNYHKNNKSLPTIFPQNIGFNFLRDNYLEQGTHLLKEFLLRKNEPYGKINLYDERSEGPLINISTEHVRNINLLTKNGKFLKSLKNNFSNFSEKNSIITELVVLHEVGHWLSFQTVNNTIISRSFRKYSKEIEPPFKKESINHFYNLVSNILEGFSDCFSVYLTQQHYSDINIILKYSNTRKETSTLSSSTIKHYDLNNILKQIENLPQKNIDLLIDDFFNISINNSINITKKLIDKNSKFEQELKLQFEYYAKDLGIILNQNNSLIENIMEQLNKSCLSNFNSNNSITLSSKIQQIRTTSLKNQNNNLNPPP